MAGIAAAARLTGLFSPSDLVAHHRKEDDSHAMVQSLVGGGLDGRIVYVLSVGGPMDAAEVQDERMGKDVEYNQGQEVAEAVEMSLKRSAMVQVEQGLLAGDVFDRVAQCPS
jgi:hypothetical protein